MSPDELSPSLAPEPSVAAAGPTPAIPSSVVAPQPGGTSSSGWRWWWGTRTGRVVTFLALVAVRYALGPSPEALGKDPAFVFGGATGQAMAALVACWFAFRRSAGSHRWIPLGALALECVAKPLRR
jgi:hypothetical protein